jgi:hypothetical protein
MLVFLFPATACQLTTNKFQDEATLYPGQERTQAENTPQTHVLEESGVLKGKWKFSAEDTISLL